MPKSALRPAVGLFVIAAAAACSGPHPATSAAPLASVAAAATHAAAPSCKQQYHAWKYGPARSAGKKLTAALDAVQSAGTTEDIPVLLASLKTAGKGRRPAGALPDARMC